MPSIFSEAISTTLPVGTAVVTPTKGHCIAVAVLRITIKSEKRETGAYHSYDMVTHLVRVRVESE